MKDFAWDITGREIMFPYPEIFFPEKTAELIPSEALKLESVANFLHGDSSVLASDRWSHKLHRQHCGEL